MCNPITTEHPEVLLCKGEHLGYEWEITSNRMGFRCGYVRIPAGHPWHGLDYDDVEAADGGYLDVHGGLTFAAPDTDCGKGGEDNAWWLGFDCGHYMDAPDPELPGYNPVLDNGGTIRSTPYVAAECRGLAEQAAAAAVRPV
jgi:hypothetical protein